MHSNAVALHCTALHCVGGAPAHHSQAFLFFAPRLGLPRMTVIIIAIHPQIHLPNRGVHEISGLKPANGGVSSFNRYSPTFLAGLLKPDQVSGRCDATTIDRSTRPSHPKCD